MDGHKLSGPTLEELRLRAVDQTSAPAAAAPGVSDLRHTVRWGMRLVLRGKYMILACMALVVVPTVLIVKQMTPRYTAEAKIVIEAPETNDLLADRALSMARMRLTDSVIQTEAELIESTMLA